MDITESARKWIEDRIDQSMIYCGLEERDAIEEITEMLYEIENCQNSYIQAFRLCIIGVIYFDAYKMFSYRQKNGLNNEIEEERFNIIADIEDTDDLMANISADPSLLSECILASYEFQKLPFLTKTIVMKSLDKSDNKFLSKQSSFHKEDLDRYDIPITMHILLREIKIKEKQQQQNGDIFLATNLLEIRGFIQNLIKVDMRNGFRLLGEIAYMDYVISEVLIQNGMNIEENQKRLEFYSKESYSTIIYYYLLNPDVLFDTLYAIYSVHIRGEIDGVQFKKDDLKEDKTRKIYRKLLEGKDKTE